MMLGVFGHTAFAYTTFNFGWPVADASRSHAIDLIFAIVYYFRLPAFFLTSGFFARRLLERRGAQGFVTNRTKRIVLPLILALIPVNAAHFYVISRINHQPFPGIESVHLQHLWFLYYLAMFLVIGLAVSTVPFRGLGPAIDRALERTVGSLALPVLLGVVTAVASKPAGVIVTPIRYTPDPWLMSYYGGFFAVGWLLQRRTDLIPRLAARTWQNLAVAGVAFAGFSMAGSAGTPALSVGWATVVLRCVFTWAMVFAFTGLFLRLFDRPSGAMGYLADASYWTYLIHLPFVVLAQQYALRWQLHAVWKVLLVLGVVLSICLATYQLLVRHTPVGWLLNGRRGMRQSI
jgi:peptidoglycan/LPS O-acetylase OafA/YrhL